MAAGRLGWGWGPLAAIPGGMSGRGMSTLRCTGIGITCLQVVEGESPGQFCLLLLKARLSMFWLQLVVPSHSPAWRETSPAVVLSWLSQK